MAETAPQSSGELSIQSTFIPFKLAQQRKADLLQQYYYYLTNIELAPAQLVQVAMALTATNPLFDDNETAELEEIIQKLQLAINDYIDAESDYEDEALSRVRNIAYFFIKKYEQFDLIHGGSYSVKAKKATTVWDVLAKALSINGYSTSNVGFPIHYSQRILAEFAFERVQHNYDFIAVVVGKRGVGKSTWALEFASAFEEKLGQQLTLDNIILTEKRDDLFSQVKTWPPKSCHIFDEAINQLFSRDFFKGSDFISLLTEIRYKRTVNLFIIPELYQIDRIMRDGLADLLVDVTERGKAVLVLPQLSGNDRFDLNANNTTNSTTIIPEELTASLLTKENAIAVSYFSKIPDTNQLYIAYQGIKDKKISTREIMQQSTRKNKEVVLDKIILDIAINHPDKPYLTSLDVRQYSEDFAFYISDKDVANYIAKNIGLKKEELYVKDAQGVMRIDLNIPLIRAWLRKLAQTARGN